VAERATSCSGLGSASFRKTSALSRLPTAVVAPIATISVTTTIKEKVGARRRLRKECRTSRRRASHMRLRGNDRDSTALARTSLPKDHDVDVLIQRGQQVHEPFDGESRELVVPKGRHLRLAQAQD